MTDTAGKNAELLDLASAVEAHLTEAGHAVVTTMSEDLTNFEIRTIGDAATTLCRVQALAGGMWELVQPNGETLTSLGGRDAFLTMIERVVAAAARRAA